MIAVHSFARRMALAALACTLLLVGAAAAGPVADFESKLNAAYADYRMALVLTNQKNADGTMKAIAGFETKWSALAATYAKAPPPQYVDDAKFAATIASVAATNERAKALAAAGKLAESHDVLEEIREELGHLRLRNGMMSFSDRMNAFHTQMEYATAKSYGGFSAAGLAELREDAAVLVYLGDDLKRHPPANATSPDFTPALQALLETVATVQKSARDGNGEASKAALGKLKGLYGRLFAKFG